MKQLQRHVHNGRKSNNVFALVERNRELCERQENLYHPESSKGKDVTNITRYRTEYHEQQSAWGSGKRRDHQLTTNHMQKSLTSSSSSSVMLSLSPPSFTQSTILINWRNLQLPLKIYSKRYQLGVDSTSAASLKAKVNSLPHINPLHQHRHQIPRRKIYGKLLEWNTARKKKIC